MAKGLVREEVLFEVKDILGRQIRTTKTYWLQIREIKHRELKYGIREVKSTLKFPDEIRESVTDPSIFLYTKEVGEYDILVVAVKVLNGQGFIVTVYQTKHYKRKGELVWQKEET